MVTGHRPKHLTAVEAAWSQVALHRVAWRLRSGYDTKVGTTGMALGADTWWGLAVLGSGMDLHAYIPYTSQPDAWPAADRALWAELRRRARHEVVVGGTSYDVRALHARNDAMLDATETAGGLVIVLYKPGTAGGTATAVATARRRGLPILLLDPGARAIVREGW